MKEQKETFILEHFLKHPNDAYQLSRATIVSRLDLKLHDHTCAEIFWIDEGYGVHFINGYEVPLNKGVMCMIRPADTHTFKAGENCKGLVITNIAFRKKDLEYYRTRYFNGSDSYFWVESDLPYSYMLSIDQYNRLSAMIDELFLLPNTYLHMDVIMLYIFKILKRSELREKKEDALIPNWLAYALRKYNTPEQFKEGVSGFVQLTNRSTDHVNRVLKKHFKQTLSNTINQLKLKHAVLQLECTNTPIKAISFQCGFNTVNYFYRVFKKFYGITPLEYRRKHQQILL